MEGSLISQGLELMLYGMGTVIVFLTMLVFATGLMSRLVMRFDPPMSEPRPPAATDSASTGPDAKTLAAISAAIHQHRTRR